MTHSCSSPEYVRLAFTPLRSQVQVLQRAPTESGARNASWSQFCAHNRGCCSAHNSWRASGSLQLKMAEETLAMLPRGLRADNDVLEAFEAFIDDRRGHMRTSQLATLVAAAAISLPLLAYTASAVDASPHTAPAVGKQLAELRGSGTVAGDSVGFATAISGTTAIVGAYEHAKGAGVAYIFKMTGSTWNQVAELQGSDTVAGDEFGSAVAISDTTAVVGAGDHAGHAGRAYVFTKTVAGWKQTAKLKGGDTVAGDYFGWSVSTSGTTVAVGAYGHAKSSGRVYVFSESTGWKQIAELKCADTLAGDQFGSAVAISGTTMVAGATSRAASAGRAYVFTKTVAGWKQTAKLEGSDTAAGDHFGWSVGVSGTTAIVGGFLHAKGAGRAYVFTETPGGWRQVVELKGKDTIGLDGFGISVGISAATAVVGATGHAGGAGRVYVFTKSPSGWKQVAELKGSDTAPGDEFGFSIGISGTTAVVGAPLHAAHAGLAYVLDV